MKEIITFVYQKSLTRTFKYKITFVNSQDKNTNSKGDFVLKMRFETFSLKISGLQKLYDSDLV